MHRLLVALLLTQGCAFGIEGPDPDRPRSQMPKCDTGKGAVVLDGTMATLAGVIALSLAGENEPAIALVPLSIGALYTAGAVKGNSAANRCREAMSEFESYVAARDTLPAETTPVRSPVRAETTLSPRAEATPSPRAEATPPPSSAAAAGSPPSVAAPAPAAPAAPAPAPAVATKKPAAPPPRAAPASSEDSAGDDEWSAFWREVP